MPKHKKILHVVGARPNFIKVGPLYKVLRTRLELNSQLLIHTGQHFDKNMSDIFFDQLEIPHPDINLGVSGGNGLNQLSEMLTGIQRPINQFKPDCIVVYGDTNSTLAGALAGAKLSIPVAHVEAGLRSRDPSMPEEANRIITDNLSSYLFTPSLDADKNLLQENINENIIHFVGNIMIDTLVSCMDQIHQSNILRDLNLVNATETNLKSYQVLTLHRPSNVDNEQSIKQLLQSVLAISPEKPIVFPIHPRAESRIKKIVKQLNSNRLICTQPLGYIDFLCLLKHANLVITDSGGIQEETTYLRTPCITLRTTTERPITISHGTNTLINPKDPYLTDTIANAIQLQTNKKSTIPEQWDGKTSERIADILIG